MKKLYVTYDKTDIPNQRLNSQVRAGQSVYHVPSFLAIGGDDLGLGDFSDNVYEYYDSTWIQLGYHMDVPRYYFAAFNAPSGYFECF